MKILFFITGLQKSGAETQMMNLIEQLNNYENITIKVISLTGGYYESRLNKLNIDVSICSNKSNYNIVNYIKFFRKEVQLFNPDIVHSFLFHSNIISKFSLFLMEKDFKLICSYRDVISNHPLIYQLEKINKSKPDILISNSNQANEDVGYLKHPKSKSYVINNGVKFNTVSPLNIKRIREKYKNKAIIITIARFAHQKDYFTNVKTCYELSKIRNDFIFLYVGEGSLKNETRTLVKNYSLDHYIEFLGKRNDINELMKASEICFLPTLHESQSNVFIEAMYYQLPILTTNIKENTDLIKNGVFCEIKDSFQMAQCINSILNNGYRQELLKENYIYSKKHFSLTSMSKNYYKIYSSLLK